MITSTGPTDYSSIIKELQYSEAQDARINREQADSFFAMKIADTRSQILKIREEADKIGSMGWINFGFSLFNAALSFAGPLFSKCSQTTQKIMGSVMAGLKTASETVQQLLNSCNQKAVTNLHAQQAQWSLRAEIDSRLANEADDGARAAAKRADEARQAVLEMNRDNADAVETMVKI